MTGDAQFYCRADSIYHRRGSALNRQRIQIGQTISALVVEVRANPGHAPPVADVLGHHEGGLKIALLHQAGSSKKGGAGQKIVYLGPNLGCVRGGPGGIKNPQRDAPLKSCIRNAPRKNLPLNSNPIQGLQSIPGHAGDVALQLRASQPHARVAKKSVLLVVAVRIGSAELGPEQSLPQGEIFVA